MPLSRSITLNCSSKPYCKVRPRALAFGRPLANLHRAGLFDVVVKVLAGLAAELTMDGHLTPVPMKEGVQKLTLEAFLRNPHRSTKVRRTFPWRWHSS